MAFLCLAIFTLALISGCSSSKAIWGSLEKGLNLNYRFLDGEPLTYKMESKNLQVMSQMGRTMEINIGTDLEYTVTSKGKKDDNFSLDIAVDTLSMDLKGPGMPSSTPDFSGIIGKSFTLILSKYGDEIDMIGADSLVISSGMGQKSTIENQVHGIFTTLPEVPVTVGYAWTDTTTRDTKQSGMDITIKSVNNKKIEGVETVMGMECVKISVKSTGILDGTGKTQGVNMTLEGDVETDMTFYFAYKTGTLVKVQTEAFTEGTIAITGAANMTMPMSGETENTIVLVK